MGDMTVEDIGELTYFRIAIVPKSWRDAYGDQTRKTAQEIADCLNQVTDWEAKFTGGLRNIGIKPTLASKPKDQTPKWKNKPKKWGKKPKRKETFQKTS